MRDTTPTRCPACGKRFKSRRAWSRHDKDKHGGDGQLRGEPAPPKRIDHDTEADRFVDRMLGATR